jgi:hypothetical protein
MSGDEFAVYVLLIGSKCWLIEIFNNRDAQEAVV